MLDINYIRDHAKKVKQACQAKNLNADVVDNLIKVDDQRRQLIAQVQDLRTQRNTLSKQLQSSQKDKKLLHQATEVKQQLQDVEPQLRQTEEAYLELMLQIPNVPLEDVPSGDASKNKVIRTWGDKPKFDFQVLDHVDLAKKHHLIDFDRGSKVAGFRGYYLKNEAVLLQQALMNYALQKFVRLGYTPVIAPVINKRNAFINSGHFPWGEKETYRLQADENDPQNDYFLAGTSEVPLVSLYADETLKHNQLPIKLVGFTPCYRREIGNYGQDTKGCYRVHEFFKIEQVVLCANNVEESLRWHEDMLKYTEEVLQELNLHYRAVLMASGDMGEPQAKKYDLEVWMPGRDDYGEAASDSVMLDFQSRRANIRYQDKDNQTKFVHTLNNTVVASPRLLIAILENYQQADGSIKIPQVLVPFVGQDTIGGEK